MDVDVTSVGAKVDVITANVLGPVDIAVVKTGGSPSVSLIVTSLRLKSSFSSE